MSTPPNEEKLDSFNSIAVTRNSTNTVADSDPAGSSYLLSIEQCCNIYGTDILHGLQPSVAKQLLDKYGQNNLGEGDKISFTRILVHQVFNAMIMVLIISMIIALAIKDWITGGVIAFIISLNVGIGGQQEYVAQKTMNSLKNLSSPTARVIRDAADMTIHSNDVVPGDLVMVQVGDTIPADIRLVETTNFETDEALLTGESLPVSKNAYDIFSQEMPVGDRTNMAFSSSNVTKGRATGIVVATGLNTEIGKIAQSLQTKRTLIKKVENKEEASFKDYVVASFKTAYSIVGYVLGTTEGTPLKKRLSKLAVFLFFIAVLFAIIVMASQKMKVNKEVAIYAVCVALSMIPSSLVVVLTITMAVGAKVMSQRNVIVRKFDALENLGSVNAICSDKTGTLTQGRMIVKNVFIPNLGTFAVVNSVDPFDPSLGEVEFIEKTPIDIVESDINEWTTYQSFQDKFKNTEKLSHFMKWTYTATLANIAIVFKDTDPTGEHQWKARGDPTEIAIQVFTTRIGFPRSKLTEDDDAIYTHLAEFPFDSSIKRMSAVYHNKESGKDEIYTKGAVERVIRCCSTWTHPETGNATPLTEDDIKFVEDNMDALSSKGLRVLAFANKYSNESKGEEWSKVPRADIESGLHFLGLVGIYDPPRPESLPSVKKCHKAGITVHMATGDHPSTARAIAQEVGILPHNVYHYSKEAVDAMVLTATQFDALSDDEIDALPLLPLVIARCAPNTKVRLVDALHRRGQIVAMTGDGVNDSPSLKKSDIGIAMGKNGSDVAKDASDIVLSDDNFASILNAVEEGRRMGDNIQKFVLQLLALNVAQALYLMIGLVFKDEDGLSVFPLSPVEVLWVIVVTSCFPAMGLGLEKASIDIMEKPPKDGKESIFTWEVLIDMIVYGFVIAACCMGPFVIEIYGYGDGELGRNCNSNSYEDTCYHVFKARTGSFAVMTWCALILAWEVIDLRRSMFLMNPEADNPYTQWMKDLWDNQFLFWSVIAGFVTLFPTVYIPVINTKVFLHRGATTGWGYAICFTACFWILTEVYKFFKRAYFKRHGEQAHNPEHDLEKNSPFSKYASFSRDPTVNVEGNVIH